MSGRTPRFLLTKNRKEMPRKKQSEQIRVRMIVAMEGPVTSRQPGEVYLINKEEAQRIIAAGYGTEVGADYQVETR